MRKFQLSNGGFSLVELIVVIAVIGGLLGVAVITLNPVVQIKKAEDAEKRNDLLQMKNALDQYYYDNSQFPDTLTMLQAGGYISKLPKSTPKMKYIYDTTSTNRQWYALFLKKSSTAGSNGDEISSCQLECIPAASRKDYICTYGGQVECAAGTLWPGTW